MKNVVIIPTYNEKSNLSNLLPTIFYVLPEVHVLIVDDNSPDNTAELVIALQKNTYFNRLFLLHRPKKLGLGTAYIEGFEWALQRKYQYIFQMDADFSHNPCYLPEFLKQAQQGTDLVLGSRYIHGGGIQNWGWIRRFISLGGSFYARMILKLPFHDLTGGFKCFHANVLKAIDLRTIHSSGYAFQIEMTYRVWLKKFSIKEIPIIFIDRYTGHSKMSKKIFLEAIWMVLLLRWHKRNILKL